MPAGTDGSRIKSGELKPGARLPPERELASGFGVAYDTVRRAAVLLRERGLIITVHGPGYLRGLTTGAGLSNGAAAPRG